MIAVTALGCSKLGTDPSWGPASDPRPASNSLGNTDGEQPGQAIPGSESAAEQGQTEQQSELGAGDRPELNAEDNSAQSEPEADDDPNATPSPVVAADVALTQPSRLPVHHLNAAEYNTTIAQLLATQSRPADYFPAAGSSEFDTHVGVLASLPPVLVQGYYDAARELAKSAMADDAQRAEILDCDPAQAAEAEEAECVRTWLTAFGQRAYRRPLTTGELDRYVQSYATARSTLGLDARGASEHVLRIVLSSPNFFLHIEALSDDVDAEQSKSIAFASRLSFLLWSSGPDTELLSNALNGSLSSDEDVLQQVNRMLEDERSGALVRDFVGQWLGLRRLPSHDVDGASFPVWNDEMLAAMSTQAESFVGALFTGERRWADFLTAEPPAAPALDALLATDPRARSGFLTLPAFLTLSSHSDRTAPTTRATTILGGLLCTNITPPANVDIPDLTAAGEGTLGESNIRKRLEEHRAAEECAACHAVLDPIGLSLENYDAIGQYRTQYGNGSAVDASGEYGGVAFDDVRDLVPSLASDPRYARCPVEKLASYALRRRALAEDRDTLDALTVAWDSGPLDDLVRRLATHPMFSPKL